MQPAQLEIHLRLCHLTATSTKTCMRVLIGCVPLQIVLTILIQSNSQRQLQNECCQLTYEHGIPPFCQKGTHQCKKSNKILIVLFTKHIFDYSKHRVLVWQVLEQDAVDGINGQLFNCLVVEKWKKRRISRKNGFTHMRRKRTKRR